MIVLEIIVAILLILGCFFAVTAGVGMLRMPDFYTRLHPAGKADTLGQMLVLIALVIMVLIGPPGDRGDTGDPMVGDDPAVHADADHAEHSAAPDWPTAVKLVLIVAFLLITCPTATHAITRAAHLAGLNPWMNDESRSNESNANAAALAASEDNGAPPQQDEADKSVDTSAADAGSAGSDSAGTPTGERADDAPPDQADGSTQP